MPAAVDIYGSMDYDERERRVIDFSEGRTRLFATKKSLSGSGCNFQRHCHRAIFVGIDYEFNDFVQAIHRIYRFLQTERVIIDIIYTEAEDPIYRALMQKWKQHDELQAKMREIIRKYGLSGAPQIERMARSIGVKRVETKGKHFTAFNNDCVEELERMGTDSVDPPDAGPDGGRPAVPRAVRRAIHTPAGVPAAAAGPPAVGGGVQMDLAVCAAAQVHPGAAHRRLRHGAAAHHHSGAGGRDAGGGGHGAEAGGAEAARRPGPPEKEGEMQSLLILTDESILGGCAKSGVGEVADSLANAMTDTALIGAMQAATGYVLEHYFKKSTAENTAGGITYDAALGTMSNSDTSSVFVTI